MLVANDKIQTVHEEDGLFTVHLIVSQLRDFLNEIDVDMTKYDF